MESIPLLALNMFATRLLISKGGGAVQNSNKWVDGDIKNFVVHINY